MFNGYAEHDTQDMLRNLWPHFNGIAHIGNDGDDDNDVAVNCPTDESDVRINEAGDRGGVGTIIEIFILIHFCVCQLCLRYTTLSVTQFAHHITLLFHILYNAHICSGNMQPNQLSYTQHLCDSMPPNWLRFVLLGMLLLTNIYCITCWER